MKLDSLNTDFALPDTVESFRLRQVLPCCERISLDGRSDATTSKVCVYVGQGGGKTGIRDRFHHHYNKAHGIQQSGTSHGKGWVANRLNEDWAPDTWTVEYFCCEKATNSTYL